MSIEDFFSGMNAGKLKTTQVVNAVSGTLNETLHSFDKKLASNFSGIIIHYPTAVAACAVGSDMVYDIAKKLDSIGIVDEAEFVRECMKMPRERREQETHQHPD